MQRGAEAGVRCCRARVERDGVTIGDGGFIYEALPREQRAGVAVSGGAVWVERDAVLVALECGSVVATLRELAAEDEVRLEVAVVIPGRAARQGKGEGGDSSRTLSVASGSRC